VFRDNLLLAALTTEHRRILIGDDAPVRLEPAETLSAPDDDIRHVYFPLEGSVSLVSPGAERAQLQVGLVGHEGMLGVPLLLGVESSPFRARVQGAGHAWRVATSDFLRTIETYPPIRAELNRYLYVFLAQLMQTSACTRFHRVEARLARWMLMSRDRAQSSHFHVTHEFLAQALGVRRVGITCAASALQRRGLIHYRRGDVSIVDVRGLARAACPCYAADKGIYSAALPLVAAKLSHLAGKHSPTAP
jgi:CRP-like cAMP-binding protein